MELGPGPVANQLFQHLSRARDLNPKFLAKKLLLSVCPVSINKSSKFIFFIFPFLKNSSPLETARFPTMAKRQATTGAVAPASKKVKTPSKEDITPVVVAKKSTNGKSSTSTTKTATSKSKEIPTKTKSSIISPSIEKEEITLPTTTRKRKVAPEDNDQTLVKKVASEKKDSKKKEVKVATKPTSKKGGSKEPIQPSSEATPSSSLKSALKPVVPTKTLSEADDVDFIHGFTSSSEGGADSSDEDDSDFEGDDKAIEDEKIGKGKKRVDVSMLPTIAKDDKSVQRKLAKARRKQVSVRRSEADRVKEVEP